jgi:hypothetical protein
VHRRRRGHRDLRRGAGPFRNEIKFIDGNRRAAAYLAAGIGCGELRFVSFGVVESEHGVAHFESLGQPDEFLPVGGAAEFAVGDDLQAAGLLKLHDVTNRFVLSRAEFGFGDLSHGVPPEGVAQLPGTQKAADVVGAAQHGVLLGMLSILL